MSVARSFIRVPVVRVKAGRSFSSDHFFSRPARLPNSTPDFALCREIFVQPIGGMNGVHSGVIKPLLSAAASLLVLARRTGACV
jgi:hypothetical protein